MIIVLAERQDITVDRPYYDFGTIINGPDKAQDNALLLQSRAIVNESSSIHEPVSSIEGQPVYCMLPSYSLIE